MAHGELASCLDTLALAYAAAGQFTNASTEGLKAIEVAEQKTLPEFVSKLKHNLLAYQAGRMPESDWINDFKILIP